MRVKGKKACPGRPLVLWRAWVLGEAWGRSEASGGHAGKHALGRERSRMRSAASTRFGMSAREITAGYPCPPPLSPRAPGYPTGLTFGERQHVTATDLMLEVKVLQEHKPTGAAVRRPPKRGPIRVTWRPRYPTARGYGHSRAHTLHLFFFARRAGVICGARAVSPRRHSSS